MTQQGDKQTHPERGNSVGQLANRFLQPVNGGGGAAQGENRSRSKRQKYNNQCDT